MSDLDTHNSYSADDALPPVEPPNAGFLVQLFLIPGIIVSIIVVVWLLFHWLAQMGSDPRDYVKKLRGNNEVRWQAAVNLAGALGNPENQALRSDTDMAEEMSQILREEIKAGKLDKTDLTLREYLCVALGKFNSKVQIPTLIEAATTERDPAEEEVQLAAVVGLGDAATSFREANVPLVDAAEVVKTLKQVSKSDGTLLRGATALALGNWGGIEATDRLAEMLNDAQPRVRYAAATALAQLGDARAIDTIKDMLSDDAPAADVAIEAGAARADAENASDSPLTGRDDTSAKLPNLLGLKAVGLFADANHDVDLSALAPSIERLTQSKIPEVRQDAIDVRGKIAKRGGN
jgi:HEAT repeat protein